MASVASLTTAASVSTVSTMILSGIANSILPNKTAPHLPIIDKHHKHHKHKNENKNDFNNEFKNEFKNYIENNGTNTPSMCSDTYTINTNTIDMNKRFIIGLYKDLPKVELQLLQSYGKVLEFHEAYKQIRCNDLDFDYLIFDFRDKENFLYYNINIRGREEYYYLVLYKHSYEKNNGLSFHNELTELPPRQINKKIYDKLLLQEVNYPPNWCISLFRSCCGK